MNIEYVHAKFDECAQRKSMNVYNANRWVWTKQIDECVFLDFMNVLTLERMSVYFDEWVRFVIKGYVSWRMYTFLDECVRFPMKSSFPMKSKLNWRITV